MAYISEKVKQSRKSVGAAPVAVLTISSERNLTAPRVIYTHMVRMFALIGRATWISGAQQVNVLSAGIGLESAFVMLNHVTRMTILHTAVIFMKKDWFEGTSSNQEQRDKNR